MTNSSGYVSSRQNRETLTFIDVIDNRDEWFEQGGSPWLTLCTDHAETCGHPTRKLAESHAAQPSGWCSKCQAQVYGPEHGPAGPARIDEIAAAYAAAQRDHGHGEPVTPETGTETAQRIGAAAELGDQEACGSKSPDSPAVEFVGLPCHLLAGHDGDHYSMGQHWPAETAPQHTGGSMFIAATGDRADSIRILAAAGYPADVAAELLTKAGQTGSAELGSPEPGYVASVKTLRVGEPTYWLTVQPDAALRRLETAAALFPPSDQDHYAGTELETTAERARREQDQAAEAIPAAAPDDPPTRLLRAVYGACPDHDACTPADHPELAEPEPAGWPPTADQIRTAIADRERGLETTGTRPAWITDDENWPVGSGELAEHRADGYAGELGDPEPTLRDPEL